MLLTQNQDLQGKVMDHKHENKHQECFPYTHDFPRNKLQHQKCFHLHSPEILTVM
jgi:hypothetical protein